MLQYLPVKAFGIWHRIPRFFVTTAAPAFASSGAVITKVTDMVSSGGAGVDDSSSQEKNRSRIEKDYGLSRDLQLELQGLAPSLMFGENTVGANSEAMHCLKKGASGTWGMCDDYAVFVKELAQRERNMAATAGDGRRATRLKIKAFFAESDALIGKKGQIYFEECWQGQHEEYQDVLDFTTETIEGVDHDTLTHSAHVLRSVFIEAGGSLDNETGCDIMHT
jgi:hypothetical protein